VGCTYVHIIVGDGRVSVLRLCNCVALPGPGDSAGTYIIAPSYNRYRIFVSYHGVGGAVQVVLMYALVMCW
jgi:hypothetical protein